MTSIAVIALLRQIPLPPEPQQFHAEAVAVGLPVADDEAILFQRVEQAQQVPARQCGIVQGGQQAVGGQAGLELGQTGEEDEQAIAGRLGEGLPIQVQGGLPPGIGARRGTVQDLLEAQP